ncbi:MAG: hypothetical protein QW456_07105 [Ignisphaera sp.]
MTPPLTARATSRTANLSFDGLTVTSTPDIDANSAVVTVALMKLDTIHEANTAKAIPIPIMVRVLTISETTLDLM